MENQNTIIDNIENGNISITDVETLQTIHEGCMDDMQTENGNLSDLPLIIEATTPEKKESEQIVKLNLEYPTKHMNGFNELRTVTRLPSDKYILIINAFDFKGGPS